MPITDLKEPIWERQDGETPNQYCYFLEFLEFPTFNLREFHDHLCEENKKNQNGTNKGKIVTYNTIRKWARESCNNWRVRKEAKRASEKEDILNTLHEIDKQDTINNFNAKKEIKQKLLERIRRDIDMDLPLSQINQGIQGLKTLHEDDLLDQEKATEYTRQDMNVEADATLNNPGLKEIAEAYSNGRRQYHNDE
jgi:hypothetical protein